jgi:hypothetical protein
MIYRNVEKALNLSGVQVERQNPARSRRLQQAGH